MATNLYNKHFSQNNIPFGIASSDKHGKQPVTRIDDTVIFLHSLLGHGLQDVSGLSEDILKQDTLNAFAALPKAVQNAVRKKIQEMYVGGDGLDAFPAESKVHVSAVKLHLPISIGDFLGKSAFEPPIIQLLKVAQTTRAP